MRFLLASLALTTLAASSRPADACGPPPCWPGAFVPGHNATIPENAPGLYWRPSVRDLRRADPSTVRLVRYGDTTPIPVTPVAQGDDWVLVPQAPLVAGTQYVLEESQECNGGPGARAVFTVGPSAPLPTTLGRITYNGHAQPTELEVAAGGSCSLLVDVEYILAYVDRSPDVAPWKDLLLYETLVDGAPWRNQTSLNVLPEPGASWRGRGEDLLYRICEPSTHTLSPGLAPGSHEVAFRATLPGAQLTLETPADRIEVMCSGEPQPMQIDNDAAGCASTTPGSGAFVLVVALLLVHRTRRYTLVSTRWKPSRT